MVKYSHNFLRDPKVWCNKKAIKGAKVLKEQQEEMNPKQSALMKAGALMTETNILYKETQIQKYVQDCRSSRHKGQVDSLEDVDQIVEMYNRNDKLLRSALCKEM